MIEPENREQLLAIGIDPRCIISCKDVQFKVVAQSTIWPGLATLVQNLVTTSALTQSMITQRWHEPYCEGLDKEIYRFRLGEMYHSIFFSEVPRRQQH